MSRQLQTYIITLGEDVVAIRYWPSDATEKVEQIMNRLTKKYMVEGVPFQVKTRFGIEESGYRCLDALTSVRFTVKWTSLLIDG